MFTLHSHEVILVRVIPSGLEKGCDSVNRGHCEGYEWDGRNAMGKCCEVQLGPSAKARVPGGLGRGGVSIGEEATNGIFEGGRVQRGGQFEG